MVCGRVWNRLLPQRTGDGCSVGLSLKPLDALQLLYDLDFLSTVTVYTLCLPWSCSCLYLTLNKHYLTPSLDCCVIFTCVSWVCVVLCCVVLCCAVLCCVVPALMCCVETCCVNCVIQSKCIQARTQTHRHPYTRVY